jgi:hypothetical protein
VSPLPNSLDVLLIQLNCLLFHLILFDVLILYVIVSIIEAFAGFGSRLKFPLTRQRLVVCIGIKNPIFESNKKLSKNEYYNYIQRISYFLSTQKSSEKGLEQQSIHKDQEPQRK